MFTCKIVIEMSCILESDLQEWFVIDFVQTKWIDPEKLALAMVELLQIDHCHIKMSSQIAARDWMGLEWKTNRMMWDHLSGQNAATSASGLLDVVDIEAEG